MVGQIELLYHAQLPCTGAIRSNDRVAAIIVARSMPHRARTMRESPAAATGRMIRQEKWAHAETCRQAHDAPVGAIAADQGLVAGAGQPAGVLAVEQRGAQIGTDSAAERQTTIMMRAQEQSLVPEQLGLAARQRIMTVPAIPAARDGIPAPPRQVFRCRNGWQPMQADARTDTGIDQLTSYASGIDIILRLTSLSCFTTAAIWSGRRQPKPQHQQHADGGQLAIQALDEIIAPAMRGKPSAHKPILSRTAPAR